MTRVTIRSRVARPLTFAVPHRPCCVALGRCRCRAHVPLTIQIFQPYGLARDVEEADLAAPDIVRALKAGEIVVVRERAPRAPRAAVSVGATDATDAPADEPRATRSSGGRRRSS